MGVFSDQERADIAGAIREIEERTAGELVVHVVERSADYAAPRGLASLAVGLGLAKVLVLESPSTLSVWSLEVAGLGVALIYLATGIPWLLRRVVPPRNLHRAVHQRALRAFTEDRVHVTKDATGVLILISEAERRVEILADAGIHARVGTSGWEKYVADLIAAIRERRAGAGTVDLIRALGRELQAAVPPVGDNPDELANEVIVSKS
ncbi:MAG: hypothetical protein AAFU79_12295 [Myxococcota bacterium]